MHKSIERMLFLLRKKKHKEFDEAVTVARRRNLDINNFECDRELVSDKIFDYKTSLELKNKVYCRCEFEEYYFRGKEFENCIFYECQFNLTYFEKCDISTDTVTFFKCLFTVVTFDECSLVGTNFFDSFFFKVKMKNTDIQNSIFDRNAFFDTKFIDNCNLKGAYFKFINWADIQFINDNSYTKLDASTQIKEFEYRDKLYSDEFAGYVDNKNLVIGRTFRNFNRQYRLNDEYRQEQELLYLAHCYEDKDSRGLKKMLCFISKISCGYGEKWTYSIAFSLSLILIFAVIYMFLGIEVTNINLLKYNLKDLKGTNTYIIDYSIRNFSELTCYLFIIDLIISIYYSMMTFTTVGYGNINTISLAGMIVSTIEMFLGAVLMAVMVGTVFRNATR